MGFSEIGARGYDISPAQIGQAGTLTRDLSERPGVDLEFSVADLRDPLPEPDGSVDISLRLYSVLNHLPLPALPRCSADLARVTSGYFITTVRSIGSTPSAMVGSVGSARHDAARRLGLAHLLALGAQQHG